MAQPAPLLRVMLRARHRFHALPVRPTLWYWVCVQLIPLPRLCLNVFLSHSLLGNQEGQLPQGFTAATLPGPAMGRVLWRLSCAAAQPLSAAAMLALPPPPQSEPDKPPDLPLPSQNYRPCMEITR